MQLSISQYANKIGVSRQAVLYRINGKKFLPGVEKSMQDFSGMWVLTISKLPTKKEAEKHFRKKL